MMLAYNPFLLFKIDFANGTEYRQQIKTFRLKYIFLVGKIIRMARSVVLKLSTNYSYREISSKVYPEKTPVFISQAVICIKGGLRNAISNG